jgi:hypothetical protein
MSPPLSSPRFQLGVREGDYKLVWGQPAALHRSYREAKEEGGLRLERPVLELYNLRQGGSLLLISNLCWGKILKFSFLSSVSEVTSNVRGVPVKMYFLSALPRTIPKKSLPRNLSR